MPIQSGATPEATVRRGWPSWTSTVATTFPSGDFTVSAAPAAFRQASDPRSNGWINLIASHPFPHGRLDAGFGKIHSTPD